MINFFNDSKIYIFCPANLVTGGTELLHQLVDYLRNHNRLAYIYYYNCRFSKIPDSYKKYNIETITNVEDKTCNIAIFPEIEFHLVKEYNQIQKVLWWLSIDNYYIGGKSTIALEDLFKYSISLWTDEFIRRTYRLLSRRKYINKISIREIADKEYLNVYQSEYAKLYLSKHGINKLFPLTDYINSSFEEATINFDNRKPNILYNPKKGIKFTKNLIKGAPDLCFIPIENLSRLKLRELFQTSMLYIDFGNHPGKDRLPREAALNGCCIITGKQGAAYNDVDIPIDSKKYKFDENRVSTDFIINKIRFILSHYKEYIHDFDKYRSVIQNEKKAFYSQIDFLFQTGDCAEGLSK